MVDESPCALLKSVAVVPEVDLVVLVAQEGVLVAQGVLDEDVHRLQLQRTVVEEDLLLAATARVGVVRLGDPMTLRDTVVPTTVVDRQIAVAIARTPVRRVVVRSVRVPEVRARVPGVVQAPVVVLVDPVVDPVPVVVREVLVDLVEAQEARRVDLELLAGEPTPSPTSGTSAVAVRDPSARRSPATNRWTTPVSNGVVSPRVVAASKFLRTTTGRI